VTVRRTAPQASIAEALDRMLDRGIVIDAWPRVSVAGLTLIDVDARVVVASIDTDVRQPEAVAHALFGARRPASQPAAPAWRRVGGPGRACACTARTAAVARSARAPRGGETMAGLGGAVLTSTHLKAGPREFCSAPTNRRK
jgi:hypothetical protein